MEESETTRTTRYYIGNMMCAHAFCMEESQWIDPMGQHWCAKHRDRLLLIRYGYQNRWALIQKDSYILLPSGDASYLEAARRWPDERIRDVVEVIRLFVDPQYQESQHRKVEEERVSYQIRSDIA